MNLFPYFKQVALDSGHADNVDLNTDTIKVLAMKNYTYDSSDKYVSDLGTGTELARSGALTSPTVTNGTFDAADTTLTAVGTDATGITDLLIFKDTGSDASSVLIAHIDEDQAASALSLPTNGSDVAVSFAGAGIFDL